jgi:hypothetical protein
MYAKTFTLKKGPKLAFLVLLLLLCLRTQAQSQIVRGVVSDSKGDPLPGVTVLLKETAVGTTTGSDGAYQLASPRNLGHQDVLLFSFIGFKTAEVRFNGTGTINVQLLADERQLNEVVVTALGIKREEKALGYATQTLNARQLNDARSNNFVNALSGKVAGLSLISPGSGPVNSVRVSLRGDNSLNPNGNNALIVVDGVPMNSGLTSSGVSSAYGAGSGNDVPVDFGNGISEINPDDIASITVLKGAGKAAGEFFLQNLNDFNDPRRAKFASQARTANGATSIGYRGIPSAYAGSGSQFDFLPSNLNIALVTAPWNGSCCKNTMPCSLSITSSGLNTAAPACPCYQKGKIC